MTGQRGRDMLLKVSDESDPETFTTLAGIRSNSFELNAESIDATASDSPDGWRELISGASIKTGRVRGNGVFKDADSDRRMRALFFDSAVVNWQLVIPGLGTLTGPFHIRSLQWSGAYDAEASFAIDLESAGALTFEAFA